MALSKEAQERFGVVRDVQKLVISKEDWIRFVDTYPSVSSAKQKTGASLGWMAEQKAKYDYGWSSSRVPVCNRPNGIYGKLKYEELKEQQAKVEARYKNYTGPVYAIACLHSVFVDFDRLIEFLEREKEGLKNGVLLIVGDIFDFYNLSLFRKEYGDVNVKREIEVVKGLLAVIKNYCPRIILVPGNHDSRVEKRLAEQMSPEVRASLSVNEEALSHYCKRKQMKQDDIDNVLLLAKGSIISYLAEVAGAGEMKLWHCRIGDTIFCHPERGLGQPLATGLLAREYFTDREEGAKAVILFHTHKLSSAYLKGWFIAEGGNMARRMDYMETGAMNKWGLPVVGYFKGEMKSGTLDYSRSAVFALGVCR